MGEKKLSQIEEQRTRVYSSSDDGPIHDEVREDDDLELELDDLSEEDDVGSAQGIQGFVGKIEKLINNKIVSAFRTKLGTDDKNTKTSHNIHKNKTSKNGLEASKTATIASLSNLTSKIKAVKDGITQASHTRADDIQTQTDEQLKQEQKTEGDKTKMLTDSDLKDFGLDEEDDENTEFVSNQGLSGIEKIRNIFFTKKQKEGKKAIFSPASAILIFAIVYLVFDTLEQPVENQPKMKADQKQDQKLDQNQAQKEVVDQNKAQIIQDQMKQTENKNDENDDRNDDGIREGEEEVEDKDHSSHQDQSEFQDKNDDKFLDPLDQKNIEGQKDPLETVDPIESVDLLEQEDLSEKNQVVDQKNQSDDTLSNIDNLDARKTGESDEQDQNKVVEQLATEMKMQEEKTTDSDLLSDNLKMKEEASRIQYSPPPEYEKIGQGLVYNCKDRHWACVNREAYFQCKDNSHWNQLNSKTSECETRAVYSSFDDCRKIQIWNINNPKAIQFDFCRK